MDATSTVAKGCVCWDFNVLQARIVGKFEPKSNTLCSEIYTEEPLKFPKIMDLDSLVDYNCISDNPGSSCPISDLGHVMFISSAQATHNAPTNLDIFRGLAY